MLNFLLVICFFTSCAYNGNPKVTLPPGETHLTISVGRVHKTCLDKFGGKFLTFLDQGMKEGMSCLENLQGSGAKKNRALLKKLFESKNLTFNCNDYDYFYGKEISATASTDKSKNKPDLGLVHPYVSINPYYVLNDSEMKGLVIDYDFMKIVLFHEYFHNLGYLHWSSVDYPFACEECCFSYGDEKARACKVCETDYSTVSDPVYLKDYLNWARNSSQRGYIGPEDGFRNALYLKPSSKELLTMFLDDLPSPVAVVTAKKMKELKILDHEKALQDYDLTKPFFTVVKLASEAQIALYVKQDYRAAIKIYSQIDPFVFQGTLSSNLEAKNIWDDLLYDMDFIRMILRNQKNDKEYASFNKKYESILNMKD